MYLYVFSYKQDIKQLKLGKKETYISFIDLFGKKHT